MGEKRTWDESRSPQWRYLLSKDSWERRQREKREEQANTELKRGLSKRKRRAKEKQRKNKAGKDIVYSAFPGRSDKDRYHNKEFEESHSKNIKEGITTHIFKGKKI